MLMIMDCGLAAAPSQCCTAFNRRCLGRIAAFILILTTCSQLDTAVNSRVRSSAQPLLYTESIPSWNDMRRGRQHLES